MFLNALCIVQIICYSLYFVWPGGAGRTKLGSAVAVFGALLGVGGLVARNTVILHVANFLFFVLFLLYARNMYLQRKPTRDGKS